MLLITDSICIKFIPSVGLLAGVGNCIRYFRIDCNDNTIEQQLKLNFRSKIYGLCWIKYGDNLHRIIAYGGRDLAIIELNDNHLTIIQTKKIGDWISSVHLYENDENNTCDSYEFCVLSSHSVAYRIQANNVNKSWNLLTKSSCIEKSTLYCSRIIGKQWKNTTVFGGTALGELIIWNVNSDCVSCEVYHRLSGHNGVIFSIDCSLEHNLLTTTSDDRSVKTWKTEFRTPGDWTKCHIEPMKSMFGHTARIFQHKIIVHDNTPYIITVGEDANICIWTIDGGLLLRKTQSTDAALWNLDYSEKDQILFACGSDGNIHQMHLKNILIGNICDKTQLPQIAAIPVNDDEFFSKIRVMPNGILIGLTNQNRLFYQLNGNSDNWIHINDADNLTNSFKCTLLEVHENLFAVAGYRRAIIFEFHNETFQPVRNEQFSNGIIRSFKFLSSQLYLVCDDHGACSLFHSTNLKYKSISFTLPCFKERWITAALKYEDYLIISDRSGNLHLYELNETEEHISLRNTLKRVHGKLGCTSIQRNAIDQREFLVTTTGHDGTLKTIALGISDDKKLEIWYTKKVPIIWIDKVILHNLYGSLFAGFNDNHFILCRENGQILFEFECGGGHRYWDIQIDSSRSICYFYYIRNKCVNKITFRIDNEISPYKMAQYNWHARACNVVHRIQLSNDLTLLVSGGDDNILKFSQYHAHDGLLEHITDMSLHVSNIKTVCHYLLDSGNTDDANQQLLIFSAGGRAQICATILKINVDQSIENIRETTNFMLNFNDSSRKRMGKSQTIDFDPETRFMCIKSYRKNDKIYLIAGCSDGYLRQFSYENNELHMTRNVFYGRCILNLYDFKWNNKNVLLTMATDGFICFWDLDKICTVSMPYHKLQHHHSGINSFDVMISDDKRNLFIATGGDDQSVVISDVNLDLINNLAMPVSYKTISLNDIHTAQVNGIKFIPNQKCLYTISVDQAVFKVNLNSNSAERVTFSSISDAKGISIISDKQLLIYGCGVELINC